MKGKEKLIGSIVAVILAVVAGVVGFSSDAFKAGLCEGYKPEPSPSPSVLVVEQVKEEAKK